MGRRAVISPLSKTDREKTIKEIINSKTTPHVPLVIGGGKEFLIPVIQVPLELPLYRIDSSRTWDSQQLRISDEIYDEDVFDLSNEATKESQQAQHEILCEMSESDRRNLFDLFSNEDTTRDKYFIITSEGVLVNGNCRTATLREMVAKGEGRSTFGHVYVAVIQEPVTRKQMTNIEMSLQLRDQWQLDYDWIQLTTLILRQIASGVSEKEVKKYWTQFDLKSRLGSDFNTLMMMRAELDSYLDLKEKKKEIERIRKVTGYRQLLRTFVEGTSKRTWTQDMKDEVRSYLYTELNNAIGGTSIEGSRSYTRLSDEIAQVGKHGGSEIYKILEKTGVSKEPQKASLSKVLGTTGAKKISLESVAKLTVEESVEVIKKTSKINQEKKNDRKDRADKRGVQRALGLAEDHVGNSLGFLKNSDVKYKTEGLRGNITEIREMLNQIEKLLE